MVVLPVIVVFFWLYNDSCGYLDLMVSVASQVSLH